MSVLGQMLEKYDTTTVEGRVNGLREVMQEVALAGLYRGGFFLTGQLFTRAPVSGYFTVCQGFQRILIFQILFLTHHLA
jgi:hypothetical protein